MLLVDLSKLNAQQLRRLLEAARSDGDEAVANQVLQEMARRDAPQMAVPEPPSPALPAHRRSALVPAVMAVVGVVLGLGVGWFALEGHLPGVPHPEPRPPAPRAALARTPMPAAPSSPQRPATELSLPSGGAAAAPGLACSDAASPAARTICADPALQTLEAQLQHAYAEAVAVHHAHRALLQQRQAAWQSARADVSDPEKLAQMTAARIRRLNAATLAAKRAARS